MNIVLDLRAIYGHFAGTPFIQPRLASVKTVNKWPIDPLGLRDVQLEEASEKLPQG